MTHVILRYCWPAHQSGQFHEKKTWWEPMCAVVLFPECRPIWWLIPVRQIKLYFLASLEYLGISLFRTLPLQHRCCAQPWLLRAGDKGGACFVAIAWWRGAGAAKAGMSIAPTTARVYSGIVVYPTNPHSKDHWTAKCNCPNGFWVECTFEQQPGWPCFRQPTLLTPEPTTPSAWALSQTVAVRSRNCTNNGTNPPQREHNRQANRSTTTTTTCTCILSNKST